MAHYRKIDTRILLDQKYNQLSSDGRLLFLHLLIHPNLTSLGAMHASLAGIACELDWEMERLRQAIDFVHQQGMVHYDEKARFIWLPNFLKYNAPESPNVIKSWETAFSYLPECDLQKQLLRFIQAFVSELSPAYQDALPDCFRLAKEDEAPTSQADIKPLPEAILENPQTLSEGSCQNQNTLPEGNLKNGLPLREGILKNDDPLPESLSIKHKALSIEHRALNIKQEKIVQEKNSEAKNKIEEINNIVTQNARQKRSKPPDSEIMEVFRYWQQTMGHSQAQLDEKRRKCIRSALAWGYTLAQLFDAIRGCSLTPHNRGENEQGQRYDGLHIILRSADQIDRFIRNAHSPPRRRTKADELQSDNLAAGDRWLARLQQQEEKIIHANA